MSDKSKKGGGGFKGRPPQDRGPRRGPAAPRDGERGDRPVRARREDGDRPVRSPRADGDRPARPPREGGGKPFRPRAPEGDRPVRARRDDDRAAPREDRVDRPQRPRREDGGKPFRPRPQGGERPFRARRDDDRPAPREDRVDRPQRPRREDGDRPFRPRPEGGDRPVRARRDDDRAAPRGDRGDKPFRPRPEGGDRPFRARGSDDRPAPRGDRSDKPFRPRPEGGDRPFRARSSDDRPAPRGDRGDKPFRPRREEGDKPFRPRPEGGDRPFRARGSDDRPAPRGDRGDKPFRPRREEGDKPFRPRPEGGDRPFRARSGDDRPAPRGDRGDKPFRPRREEGERPFRARREDENRSRSAPRDAEPRKEYMERVAKVMARAGLCSRRDAETWIEAGRVAVNGEVLTSPARDVGRSDKVTVDGTPLPSRERTRLFLYHKPRGLVTTARDPEGRATVFDRLPAGLPRVITVGRLDINTEGLLLLTNDGGLSRVLELPETGWLRRYRVRAFGEVTQADLDKLAGGVVIDDMHYGPVEAEIDREQGDNVWLTLGLREGKNREVKRILEHLGLQVNRLIRLSFGPFQLQDLPEGAVEEVTTRVLADQLGQELAAQAEVDFEAPVFVYEDDDFRPKKPAERRPRDEGERPVRSPREERPRRSFDEDRPQKRDRDREAPRGRGRDAAPTDERPARPPRRHPTEPVRSVWRAEDESDDRPKVAHVPRRGADPKAARAESAGREHVRAGKVTARSGRSVLVEKVARDPAAAAQRDAAPKRSTRPVKSAWSDEERPARPPRERSERTAPGGDDRPRRPRFDRDAGAGDRPPRPHGDRPAGGRKPGGFGGKPGGGKGGGGRPPRGPRRDG